MGSEVCTQTVNAFMANPPFSDSFERPIYLESLISPRLAVTSALQMLAGSKNQYHVCLEHGRCQTPGPLFILGQGTGGNWGTMPFLFWICIHLYSAAGRQKRIVSTSSYLDRVIPLDSLLIAPSAKWALSDTGWSSSLKALRLLPIGSTCVCICSQ